MPQAYDRAISMSASPMHWQWLSFNELNASDLYQILRLRQAVFAVEQNCVYQDCDNVDQQCWHLLGREPSSTAISAYLRVVPAGIKYREIAIGRVVTAADARDKGYGRVLMQEGIKRVEQQWPDSAIRISAQAHLEHFYGSLNFTRVSEPYQEDGIPHIEMLRASTSIRSAQ